MNGIRIFFLVVLGICVLILSSCTDNLEKEFSMSLVIHNDESEKINFEIVGNVSIQNQNDNKFTLDTDKTGTYTLLWYGKKLSKASFNMKYIIENTGGIVFKSNSFEFENRDALDKKVSEFIWEEIK